MSVAGEAVYPEGSTEDVGEVTRLLRAHATPGGLSKEHEEEAVDLARAPFATGAAPGEARATLAG
eukprot:7267998-Alexandrium_andersonii.AAC.1